MRLDVDDGVLTNRYGSLIALIRRSGPVVVGATAAFAALVFVLARLALAADGDISRFVVAGSVHVDGSATPVDIHVFDGAGYDGQFYWRLAVDPGEIGVAASNGVALDDPLRASRIAYPLSAWAVSLGSAGLVAWSLVVVNVLALGVLAGAAASMARRAGLIAWWGMLPAASTGFVMSLARDLNEIVMAAALLLGMAAVGGDRRRWLAAPAWAVAVLAHEQATYVVAAFAAFRLWSIARRRTSPASVDLAWVLPGLVFVGWQAIAATEFGRWPVLGSGDASVDWPFVGLVREIGALLAGDVDPSEWLVIPQAIAVVMLVVAAWWARRFLAEADRWLLIALAVGSVVSVCLSYNVWDGPAELRQMVLVPTVASVVLLHAARRPGRITLLAVAGAWVATALLRIGWI